MHCQLCVMCWCWSNLTHKCFAWILFVMPDNYSFWKGDEIRKVTSYRHTWNSIKKKKKKKKTAFERVIRYERVLVIDTPMPCKSIIKKNSNWCNIQAKQWIGWGSGVTIYVKELQLKQYDVIDLCVYVKKLLVLFMLIVDGLLLLNHFVYFVIFLRRISNIVNLP